MILDSRKQFRKFYSKSKRLSDTTRHKWLAAFTVAEMVLVTFIMLTLASLLFASYRQGASVNTLTRVATRIAQDLRRTQNLALTSLAVGGQTPCSFGVYYSTVSNPTSYIIFTDFDANPDCSGANKSYDSGAELYESVSIEPGTIISLTPASPLNIVFVPPDPTTYINGLNSGSSLIRVCLQTDSSLCRNIQVNSSGLVEVQ